MFIIVKHTIRDSKTFYEKGTAATKKLPVGLRADLFFPNKEMTSAVCLWEAASSEKVKSFLDPVLGQSSVNEYFEVDESKAYGLDRLALAAG